MTQATEATSKTNCRKKHFTPYLETPEISPPKGEKLRLDNRSTIVHTFTPIGGICAEISVPEASSCIFTYKDTKKELQQMIYMTKRILALRLSYNNERLRSRYGTTDGQKASQRASCQTSRCTWRKADACRKTIRLLMCRKHGKLRRSRASGALTVSWRRRCLCAVCRRCNIPSTAALCIDRLNIVVSNR